MPNNMSHLELLEHLNSKVETIKFTYGLPSNNKLNFIDVNVIIGENNRPLLNIYRKPTHSAAFVHWFSWHSTQTKRGIVVGQFIRAFKICSPIYLNNEINFIKRVFKDLSYPSWFINKAFYIAKKKFYTPNLDRPNLVNF